MRKYFSILFVLLGLISLALIIYFIFFHNFNAPEVATPNTNTNIINTTPEPQTKTQSPTTITQPARRFLNTEEELKRLASSFAERFGSYSNQSGYQQIKDLKIFMSQSMASWANNYIKEEIGKGQSADIYYGINTRSVSAKIEDFDDEGGNAKILVSTQRIEATGSANNTAKFSQNILITLIKENGAWKVDSAYWQER